LQKFYGTKPLANGRGGSIPFIAEFTAKFPGCDIMVTGAVGPDSFMHGMAFVALPLHVMGSSKQDIDVWHVMGQQQTSADCCMACCGAAVYKRPLLRHLIQ
jgi:hypothetical protein